MQCFVYKSLRKSDTYVFLSEHDRFDAVPDAIREPLGTLVFVVEIELSPDRRLARESAETVMSNLRRNGFHLQFPPPPLELHAADTV